MGRIKAHFSGEYAALEVQKTLEPGTVTEEWFEDVVRAVLWAEEWLGVMFRGHPLYTTLDRPPLWPQLRCGWTLLTQSRRRLLQAASRIENQIESNVVRGRPAAVALIAGLARSEAIRNETASLRRDYEKVFGLDHRLEPDDCDGYLLSGLGMPSQRGILVAVVDSGQGTRGTFLRSLREKCLDLPGVFRAEAHRASTALGRARGELTWVQVGIDHGESDYWRTFGIEPKSAGYWRAFGIQPEEVLLWSAAEFEDPSEAGAWKARGLEPTEAASWKARDFQPREAARWRALGFKFARTATAWRKHGFREAKQAKEWARLKFLPEEAAAWSEHYTPAQSRKWRDAGVRSAKAAIVQTRIINRINAMPRSGKYQAVPEDSHVMNNAPSSFASKGSSVLELEYENGVLTVSPTTSVKRKKKTGA